MRFNVEVDSKSYRKLKGLLAMQGVTISQWIRLCIEIYLKEHGEENDKSSK